MDVKTIMATLAVLGTGAVGCDSDAEPAPAVKADAKTDAKAPHGGTNGG